MLFPTIAFGIFFPIVFLASWLLRPQPQRWKLFMVVASYVFYGWWQRGHEWYSLNWWLMGKLALSTVVNQVFVVGISKAAGPLAKKIWVWIAVTANLAFLGWFKYYGFFRDQVPGFGFMPAKQVILPIAISFFTFQALSYVLDTYRHQLRPVGLLDFACYLSFFPHLVAGPIVRAREFLPQLRQRPDPRYLEASHAFRLIVAGMFKKVVVSSYLAANLVDPVFANPKGHGALDSLFGVYGYAIQIYADFSGYTDIAIGIALLLGIRFPVNFDSPYRALSLQDFWRRWHMSLSRWLRDYLYISLGGNRRGRTRTYVNLMLTMLIGGLWHGASWKFVVWGAIHGIALAIERLWADRRERLGLPEPVDTPVRRALRWLVTFHVVCFAWIFFRAENFTVAWSLIGRFVTGWGMHSTLVTGLAIFTIVAMLASQFVPEPVMQNVQARFSRFPVVAQGATLAVCFFFIDKLGPQGVLPFIYFQF